MRRLATVAAVLIGVLLVPQRAAAQDREGFWIGFGGGGGWAMFSSDQNGDVGAESSVVAYVKLGGTLNPHLLVGAELNAWRKTQPLQTGLDSALKMYNLDATLTYYPSATAGFFLKGGAGLSLLDAEVIAPSSRLQLDLGSGFGVIVGLGYDIPIGRSVSLTPALNYWGGQLGDLQLVAGQPGFSHWRQGVVDLTIGITIH